MSLVATALAIVLDTALGVWLGAIVFFSFVGAPTTFSVLDRPTAGRVVNAIFPKYYTLGVALGLLAVLAALAHGPAATLTTELFAAAIAAGVGIVLFAYSRWILLPKMEAAGDDGFARYHRQSVVLNSLTMVAVAAGLIATHL